jgi:ferrous iron transport protein B
VTTVGRVSRAAPSCHGGSTRPAAGATAPTVALLGAPNAGKSTLFNAVTGGQRTVGNWPGTTVEVGQGGWRVGPAGAEHGRREVNLLDLPGAYSLDAQSPDEELTRDLLCGDPQACPDLAVVVADAAHLARSLYLVAQLRETAQRVVVALTMLDVAGKRGVTVDEQALSARLGCPVVATDPRRRTGLSALGDAVSAALATQPPAPRPRRPRRRTDGDGDDDLAVELAIADERFDWLAEALTDGSVAHRPDGRTRSDRVDRWAMAPVIGPLLFLAVMWAVFALTTAVAAPLQDALSRLVSGPVTSAGRHAFGAVGLADSWPAGFVLDGLVAGVGMLLTFVPLMAIMFCLLALLEDSGYLARAAVVTDRVMRRIGLPGKAFLPLVVGFGCNVPAISATRILPDSRHRIMTALLIPFTSCSARLTVYVLIAATFFPHHAGTVVFGMYLTSIAMIVLLGLGLRHTLWRTVGAEPLVLDLPAYQLPTVRGIGAVTWVRVKGFLKTASGIIVVTVSLVWLLQSIPVHRGAAFGAVRPDDSAFAAVARTVSPVFSPAGFGDWHTSSALAVGFVAKEAVISSWAQTYAADDPTAGLPPTELRAHLQHAFAASSAGATTAAVLAFLVFLLAYTPCVATIAAQRREIGLRWTAFGVGMQLSVAWLLATVVFQLGRLLT